MNLIRSIFGFGSFEIDLNDILGSEKILERCEADKILSSKKEFFERIYLSYITSFTHYYAFHTKGDPEIELLKIQPKAWLGKFLYFCGFMGFGIVILLLLGETKNIDSLNFILRYILFIPLIIFGIPFILGALFFEYCVRKLRKVASQAP